MTRARLLVSALLLASACSPPADEPERGADEGGDPPASAGPAVDRASGESRLAAHLAPDTARSRDVAPGVRYHYLWTSQGPLAVHVVEADLSRCEIFLDVVPPSQVGLEGLVRVTEIARAVGPDLLVAVNGDFFTPEGSPIGAEVSEGKARFRTSRPALAWGPGREPDVAAAHRDEDSLRIDGWSLALDGPSEGAEVVGGYPQLLEGGRPPDDSVEAGGSTFRGARQPRTVVAYEPGRRRVWLLVVDGRRPEHSVGVTLAELTDLVRTLGPVDALNLDGGGSSVMVVEGGMVNRPSDDDGERPVVNALTVRRDPARCREGSAPPPSRTPDSARSAPG